MRHRRSCPDLPALRLQDHRARGRGQRGLLLLRPLRQCGRSTGCARSELTCLAGKSSMQQNEARMILQQHARRIAQMLQQAQQVCRADIGRVSDPKAQALFETVAEVLGGAMKTLEDYQKRSEPAWQPTTGG